MSKKRAPIEPLSASSHDEAPRPLVGEDLWGGGSGGGMALLLRATTVYYGLPNNQ